MTVAGILYLMAGVKKIGVFALSINADNAGYNNIFTLSIGLTVVKLRAVEARR